MPEGPELHLSSRFINNVCKGRVFGKILKSEISKNPVVLPPADRYTITASSRGKEIKITLTEIINDVKESKEKLSDTKPKSLDILLTFGLAGKFDFHEASELQKHAHLNFFTRDSGPDMVLSFVDYMRFGKWSPGMDFSLKERGPCVLLDYNNFRDNVLQNLDNSVFNKPICEVLLNQKYFNGIGNYLRAEILHRAKIPPFVSARSVLEPLAQNEVKSETPDILHLCYILPQEVVELESSWYDGKDRSDENNSFNDWLQCYYQDGMKNIADHNKRTIWYSGPLGPLAPKDGKVRARKTTKSKKKSPESEEVIGQTSKKTAAKRGKKDKESDIIEEEAVPSENKKGRLSKSARTKLAKEENKATVEGLNVMKEDLRTKEKKPVRQREAYLSGNGDLTEASKTDLQKGRLTRGKLRQMAETIEDISEEKTSRRRKKVVKTVKAESKEDERVPGYCDSDSLLYQNITEGHTDIKVEVPETLVLCARTKSRARVGSVLNNNAAYLQSSNKTQKMKLKTPRKSLRRLSST